MLELPSSFDLPDLDKGEDVKTPEYLRPATNKGRRVGPRMSRTGDERRADVLDQLGSLELDRTLVLEIAHQIEQWGATSR